jgi:hypothetical protein
MSQKPSNFRLSGAVRISWFLHPTLRPLRVETGSSWLGFDSQYRGFRRNAHRERGLETPEFLIEKPCWGAKIRPYSERNSLALGSLARGWLTKPDSSALLQVNSYRLRSRELTWQNQKCKIHIVSVGISFPLAGRKAGRQEAVAVWKLAHNLSREPGRGSDFLNYIARNPLKRLDSKK